MRDRILIAIVAFLIAVCIATSCFAWGLFGMTGSPPAGGGGTTWVYSVGSDDYPNTDSEGTLVVIGSPITPGAVTVTKISVKLSDPQSCTEGWIALYAANGSARYAYGTFTPAVGWNDVTVSYATASETAYWVATACNNTRTLASKTDAGGTQTYNGAYTYTSTPPSTLAASTYARWIGVRIGY